MTDLREHTWLIGSGGFMKAKDNRIFSYVFNRISSRVSWRNSIGMARICVCVWINMLGLISVFLHDTHEEIRLKWHFFMCLMKAKDNQISWCVFNRISSCVFNRISSCVSWRNSIHMKKFDTHEEIRSNLFFIHMKKFDWNGTHTLTRTGLIYTHTSTHPHILSLFLSRARDVSLSK